MTAEHNYRYADNAPGPFYVAKCCINCRVCESIAGEHFREAKTRDHRVVYRQPVDEIEAREARSAMLSCPVDAIKEDGHDLDRPADIDLAKLFTGRDEIWELAGTSDQDVSRRLAELAAEVLDAAGHDPASLGDATWEEIGFVFGLSCLASMFWQETVEEMLEARAASA